MARLQRLSPQSWAIATSRVRLSTIREDLRDSRKQFVTRTKIIDGIFSGMFSYPSSEEVLDELGDKVVEAFSRAVARTRDDLSTYRAWRPSWVARHGERGLGNWIHDFMWFHLTDLLDGIPEVHCIDSGSTREIMVGIKYRLRAKRHGPDGQVTTYPTQTAIEFMLQGVQDTFPGLEEVRLIVGYVWDQESREIGQPVLSLRDGQEVLIWRELLPDLGTGYESATVTSLPTVEPPAPVVEFISDRDAAASNAVGDDDVEPQETSEEAEAGAITPIRPTAEPSTPEVEVVREDAQDDETGGTSK
ncbi:hypothetical protein [Streptosporangium sandarakinum]|uniref:hypothetical protein n=1 Tax=Streptosporangium sandarakinum TaxID=1260955 RepID=UPI0036B92D8F